MNQTFTLRQHQKDGVWRGMSSGNTLLAHCVGAGKSALMAATAMKMKQAGLIKKPLIAVPNHLLEQFAREFQHTYQSRQKAAFVHEDYMKRLAELRDRLRVALSGVEMEEGQGAADIAGSIKELRAAQVVETVPERPGQRRDAGEEPVTARIRRRAEERFARDSENGQESPNEGRWQRKLAEQARARAERIREPG